jgi:L-aspartate oxidase
MMGGVVTDLEARTSLSGLFAAGEVACTGLHGANRLASNSLLEGLVFGWVAGRSAAGAAGGGQFPLEAIARAVPARDLPVDVADVRSSLQSLMTRQVGVFRNEAELSSAGRALSHWHDYVDSVAFDEPSGLELQDMLVAATLVARGALMRTESRGGHRRVDHPERDDANWQKRIEQSFDDFRA